jgi:4-hydroxybenzoate polyprenyltransferase
MDRVLASISLNKKILFCMYLLINGAGLFLSLQVSKLTFFTALAFLISAIIYNVKPIRFKDRPVLDILTESINNPIRLVGGWAAINHSQIPPLSLVISFWALGSYMMGVKRLSEFKHMSNLNQIKNLKKYRKSFNFWNVNNLMLFIMGSVSVFFFCFCAFLLRYKVEYLLLLPLLILQVLWYFDISSKNLMLGQKPEYIYRKKLFLSFCLFFVIAFSYLTYSNIEVIHEILSP